MTRDLGPGIRGRLIDGKYELVTVVGHGSLASVWRGLMHGASGFTKPVAVKRPREELAENNDFLARFVAAARVASELRHPNLVEVLDLCRDDHGGYHLIIEWVEGIALPGFVRSFSRLGQDTPWPLVAAIGVGALRGLAAAHERVDADGVASPALHGALAPHHILLATNGVAKLTDFGLAALTPRKAKLAYLAPEVVKGGPLTVRAEIHAMGAVLWEALAGVALDPAHSDIEGIQPAEGELRELEAHRSDLPVRLRDVVKRALSPDPFDRYGSANEMATALAASLTLVKWQKGAQQDLGAAVAEAKRALAQALVTAGELELTTSGVEFLPEGVPENPILLTQPVGETLSDDDVLPGD